MVDERKVGLMTKLSIYEKKQKNRDLVLSRYFQSDYVRYNVLKAWVAVTIAYWSVVGAFALISFDDILAQLNNIDYFDVMYKYLGYYVACCLILCIFTGFIYKYRYIKAKPGLIKYNSMLKDLIEAEGGPARKAKVVKNSGISMAANSTANEANNKASATDNRTRVNRSEIVKRRQAEEEIARERQIIDNVKQRNERIAARKEAEEKRQQEYQQEIMRRKQLEREHMEKLRMENMQNDVYAGQQDVNPQMARQNHTYVQQGYVSEGKENI